MWLPPVNLNVPFDLVTKRAGHEIHLFLSSLGPLAHTQLVDDRFVAFFRYTYPSYNKLIPLRRFRISLYLLVFAERRSVKYESGFGPYFIDSYKFVFMNLMHVNSVFCSLKLGKSFRHIRFITIKK